MEVKLEVSSKGCRDEESKLDTAGELEAGRSQLERERHARARADAEKAILEVAGVPLRLRDARRGLFILTTAAADGRPAIVETEAGLVCLVALDDLMELVMERGPTLAEVMQTIRQS